MLTNFHCVPSTSAQFTNLQCYTSTRVAPISTVALVQLHHSTVNLHLLATIFGDYATCQLCDYVIMLLVHSTLSTILLPRWICLVDYLTTSLKSKFLQLYRICCHLSTHLFYRRNSAPLTSSSRRYLCYCWTPFGRLHSTFVILHFRVCISAFVSYVLFP